MKETFRTCDMCKVTVPDIGVGASTLENIGWTQLRYSFGTTHNAYNAIVNIKDLCPECAKKLGMIKENEKNPEYAVRPDYKKETEQKTDTNIMEQLREFIIQIGSDEGWYKE